jgi:murein DD-endopeptidase MepM/ murein hydrolase activator NlpD
MRVAAAMAVIAGGILVGPAAAFELGFPANCTIGETCFLQQGPDTDPASGAATDSYCGGATYDGHDGTDIRVRSMADLGSVDVVASVDGLVLGMRDGVPDKLIATEADRAAIQGIECGNGVLIDHGDGWQTQYCHMQSGSVAVGKGQSVARGDVLGRIGASGNVQFPHVHLTVRKDGVAIDPFTGRNIASGCDPGTPLWAADVPPITGWDGTVLGLGMAGAPVDHASLTAQGLPAPPTAQSQAFVGWVWLANLQEGDEVTIRLEAADGTLIAEDTQPIDRNKADYSAFAGKRGAPAPGTYRVKTVVIRDGVPAISAETEVEIQ